MVELSAKIVTGKNYDSLISDISTLRDLHVVRVVQFIYVHSCPLTNIVLFQRMPTTTSLHMAFTLGAHSFLAYYWSLLR